MFCYFRYYRVIEHASFSTAVKYNHLTTTRRRFTSFFCLLSVTFVSKNTYSSHFVSARASRLFFHVHLLKEQQQASCYVYLQFNKALLQSCGWAPECLIVTCEHDGSVAGSRVVCSVTDQRDFGWRPSAVGSAHSDQVRLVFRLRTARKGRLRTGRKGRLRTWEDHRDVKGLYRSSFMFWLKFTSLH